MPFARLALYNKNFTKSNKHCKIFIVMEKGNLILVSGVDGVGKTTTLNALRDSHESVVISEPTSTPESKQFKSKNMQTLITDEFIDEREIFYKSLQGYTDINLRSHLDQGYTVATSGSRLVTLVSHNTMRRILGHDVDQSYPFEVFNCDVDCLGIDTLVLLCAPIETIGSRLRKRFDDGDRTEKIWGFNSLYFLEHYQNAWVNTAKYVQETTDLPVLKFDTSIDNPETIAKGIGKALGLSNQ